MLVLYSLMRRIRPFKTLCIMLLLNLFLIHLFSRAAYGNINLAIDKRTIQNENLKTFTAPKGTFNIRSSELTDDIYFEILSPDDIRYTYRTRLAKGFGTTFETEYKKLALTVAQPYDACSSLANTNALKGHAVLVERGQCSFLTKTIHVQEAGGRVAIVADHDPLNEFLVEMVHDNTERTANIPAVFLTYKDGHMIKQSIESQSSKFALINIPLNVTFSQKSKLRKAPWSYW